MSNKESKIVVSLEEYIPLKVMIYSDDEPIRYVPYTKGNTSLLEFSVGMTSGYIRRITLLLSEEYDIIHENLEIGSYETGDLKLTDIFICRWHKNCAFRRKSGSIYKSR